MLAAESTDVPGLLSIFLFGSRRVLIKPAIVYSDVADELGDGTVVELPGVTLGTNWKRCRAKAGLSPRPRRSARYSGCVCLEVLEGVLIEAGIGTVADVERAREESLWRGLLVRSLVGLDRVVATEAFSACLSEGTFDLSGSVRPPHRRASPRRRSTVLLPSRTMFNSGHCPRRGWPDAVSPPRDPDERLDTAGYAADVVPSVVPRLMPWVPPIRRAVSSVGRAADF